MKIRTFVSFLFVAMLASMPLMVQAQQQPNPNDEQIVVRKGDLPQAMVKEMEAKHQLEDLNQKIKTYGTWVGIGKEVGTAVNDSLSAVTTQADNFAKTGVGKFTMFLVAYKVIGKDLIGVIVGVPLLLIWLMVCWIWVWKNTMTRSVLSRIAKDGERTYQVLDRDTDSATTERIIVGIIGTLVSWLIVGQVIF